MSTGYVGEASPLLGGWFGDDGQSFPSDFVLTDGWFGEVDCSCVDMLQRVFLLEEFIKECEPVYIGPSGHLRETDAGGL